MVSEMRFHFTNQQVELGDLLTIIRPDLPKGDLRERIGDEGFMTGFIDLTFRFGHQYYILDYKTNHLGNEISDYNREKLAEAMKTHFYDLQYHLYLVALHRFLKQKLPDYDYRKHVGGALYLFVRGINENTEAGIYFDRPDKACIDELDRYFKENSAPSH
jgi:exodeoxyribonuclease V beta subunit